MEGNSGMWNPHQFPAPATEPYTSGPMYNPMNFPADVPPSYQHYSTYYSRLPGQPPPHPPTYSHPVSPPPSHHPPPHPAPHLLPHPPPNLPPHLSPHSLTVPPPIYRSQPANDTIERSVLKCENEDKEWISNWLAQRNINPASKKSPSSENIKLVDIRELLLQCLSGLKELRELHNHLSQLSDSANETTWCSSLVLAEKKKAALTVLLQKLKALDLISVKRKLSHRKKKRNRLRRKRIKIKEAQQALEAKRKTLHQRADEWLAEMRLRVEREHREQELRREADAVLGEVTRKKTEAKRQISLLDALIKLREARAQRAASHNYSQNINERHTAAKFNTVVDRLRKLWNLQLKEYDAEERGLRVMLQESAEQKSDARCQKVKSILDLWHKAIFGVSGGSGSTGKPEICELISVRQGWDKFVVPAGAFAPMASSIPAGWVLPQGPSSRSWRRYSIAYDKSD